jgi:hypothetical protein
MAEITGQKFLLRNAHVDIGEHGLRHEVGNGGTSLLGLPSSETKSILT